MTNPAPSNTVDCPACGATCLPKFAVYEALEQAEAERDRLRAERANRYRQALEQIRDFTTHEDALPDDGYLDALRMQDIASEALKERS